MADIVPESRTVPVSHGWKWFKDGWRLFRRQPGMWLALAIPMLIVVGLLGLIPYVGILSVIFTAPIFAGILIGARSLDGGGELEFGHLVCAFKRRHAGLLILGTINAFAYIVAAFIAGPLTGADPAQLLNIGRGGATGGRSSESILLTQAYGTLTHLGLYLVFGILLWFATPLIAFHRLSPLGAIRAGAPAFVKNVPALALNGAIFIGFAILATIPVMAGWLVLYPMIFTTYYASYRDIFQDSPAP